MLKIGRCQHFASELYRHDLHLFRLFTVVEDLGVAVLT